MLIDSDYMWNGFWMDLYILKIGGSVCTEKAKNVCEARAGVIRQIALEIKAAQAEKEFKLILVHGAGPFGHKLVSGYGINNGVRTGRQVEGFVRTHNSMLALNKIFLDIFSEEGLNVVSIPPLACIVQSGKKIRRFDYSLVKKLLDVSIIPVLHGDMVFDDRLGASVVSGDAIIPFLAKKLGAKKVFFGTDVAGIFTADPKRHPGAKLIKKIHPRNMGETLLKVSGSSAVDVTGGMKGKLLELKSILGGIEVFVFDSTKNGNVLNLLLGKTIPGTKITF